MARHGIPFCLIFLYPLAVFALADPSDTFQPSVSENITYDDNLFRQSSSPNIPLFNGLIRDDVINQTTVGSAVNYTLGRQKLKLDLNMSYVLFANNKFLDNISSNDRATWDWQLGKQCSGQIGYAYTRAMGGFTNTTFYGLNMITNNNVYANLNYAWHPRWKMRAGLSWQDYINSASQRTTYDQQTVTALAGLDYATPSNNSTGLEYTFSDGKYPNQQLINSTAIDNKFQQHNISALLTWSPTVKTSLNGNLGYNIRLYPDFSQRNFSGGTYNLTLNWTPATKMKLALSASRQLNNWTDTTASYIITQGFSVSPMWQVSPKLALTAKLSRQTLNYTGDQITPGPTRQDTVLNGQVSLVYTLTSNAEITLGYQGGKRVTISPPNNQPYDYIFNSVFSSVMLKF